MTRHASCCVPLCTNNFRNSPGLAFYRIPKVRRIQREYVHLLRKADLKLNSNSILLVFFEVKSPQAHLPSASHFFVFFPFNSTFHFAILNCFDPAETFHVAFRRVYLNSRPPNNPINAPAPSLGPRLSLFSKVSY